MDGASVLNTSFKYVNKVGGVFFKHNLKKNYFICDNMEWCKYYKTIINRQN